MTERKQPRLHYKLALGLLIAAYLAIAGIFYHVNTASADFAKPSNYYFDQGFRERDENGYFYWSDSKEHVLVCDGYFLSKPKHAQAVRCPSHLYGAWMRTFHGRQYVKRIGIIKTLNFYHRFIR